MEKKQVKILVVDDDKELADTLAEYLAKLEYQATAAYGGAEALTAFREGEYHLVVTDLMMPDMDGIELLGKVKQLDKKAIVLVITGYGTIESAVSAIKKGAFDFIPKPFTMEELEVIIDRALEQHHLFSQLGIFRGLTLALIVSVPLWLILGILLGLIWK
jgi:DNA-binding NtrC family response regulator